MDKIPEISYFLELNNKRKLLIVEGTEFFVSSVLKCYADFLIDEENYKYYSKSGAHLGHEYSTVGYNGCTRINPEMLNSLVGLVKSGGTLILGVSNFNSIDLLEVFKDQDLDRFRTDKKTVLFNHYLSRFKRILSTCPVSAIYSENKGMISDLSNFGKISQTLEKTNVQVDDLPEFVSQWKSSKESVLLIVGDRGTGKSTLLGKIAKKYTSEICLTSSSRASLDGVYQICPNAEFIGIDNILADEFDCDLLLVDEIGSIPIYKLEQIILKFRKIVLSGSVDGYEGNANGIVLKLIPFLKENKISYQEHKLEQGYRNEINDELGLFWRSLFRPEFFDTYSRDEIKLISNELQIKSVSGKELINDEMLVKKIYGILSSCHYQTQPSDLRLLLDDPRNIIYYAESSGHIVGVLWGMFEQISEKLVENVFLGTRRPKGNLIPQTLVAHSGFKNAGYYRYFRIARIAVNDSCRRLHIGTRLISFTEKKICEKCDFIGVSFGVTKSLLQFWHSCGFESVKLGVKTDHVTGLLSVVMLKACKPILQSIITEWRKSFLENYMLQISWLYRDQNPDLLAQIISISAENLEFDYQYLRDINSIVNGSRSPEQALSSLYRWIITHVNVWKNWDSRYIEFLFGYYVQHREYSVGEQKENVLFLRNALKQ